MNCSSDLLQAYLDNELETAQRIAVEDHIAGCEHCSGIWGRMREQKAAIRASRRCIWTDDVSRECSQVV